MTARLTLLLPGSNVHGKSVRMRAYVIRLVANFVLMLSLLAPFASSWAMAFGMAEGRILVICSGDGLRLIHLNDAGEPVELSETVETCALVNAADTAPVPEPVRAAPRFLYFTSPTQLKPQLTQMRAHLPSLPRAPPIF